MFTRKVALSKAVLLVLYLVLYNVRVEDSNISVYLHMDDTQTEKQAEKY